MKEELINLDEAVLNALDFFTNTKLPKFTNKYKNPIIIGSGNALATGKLLFNGTYANESNYKKILKSKKIDRAILISASAKKHSIKIAKHLKSKKIHTTLLTNNPQGKANKFVTKSIIFPKIPEPYTYNTSTYLAMILSVTHENPKKIKDFLKKQKIPNLKKYKSFFIIVPEKFDNIREFYQTKFDELFGPKINGRSFTYEETKHAKTVIKSDKELFISLGCKNKTFGTKKLNIKIPNTAKEGLMFCLGYYIIGKIQKQNPPYFKKSISNYVKNASKIFKQKIPLIQ
ncbi:MAG: hypothetical protein OQK82_03665 [Candidatus Pacearchaeota archaeon]|nr:hypothetical protein [Candidatus Pacearchaeota archaeon]